MRAPSNVPSPGPRPPRIRAPQPAPVGYVQLLHALGTLGVLLLVAVVIAAVLSGAAPSH